MEEYWLNDLRKDLSNGSEELSTEVQQRLEDIQNSGDESLVAETTCLVIREIMNFLCDFYLESQGDLKENTVKLIQQLISRDLRHVLVDYPGPSQLPLESCSREFQPEPPFWDDGLRPAISGPNQDKSLPAVPSEEKPESPKPASPMSQESDTDSGNYAFNQPPFSLNYFHRFIALYISHQLSDKKEITKAVVKLVEIILAAEKPYDEWCRGPLTGDPDVLIYAIMMIKSVSAKSWQTRIAICSELIKLEPIKSAKWIQFIDSPLQLTFAMIRAMAWSWEEYAVEKFEISKLINFLLEEKFERDNQLGYTKEEASFLLRTLRSIYPIRWTHPWGVSYLPLLAILCEFFPCVPSYEEHELECIQNNISIRTKEHYREVTKYTYKIGMDISPLLRPGMMPTRVDTMLHLLFQTASVGSWDFGLWMFDRFIEPDPTTLKAPWTLDREDFDLSICRIFPSFTPWQMGDLFKFLCHWYEKPSGALKLFTSSFARTYSEYRFMPVWEVKEDMVSHLSTAMSYRFEGSIVEEVLHISQNEDIEDRLRKWDLYECLKLMLQLFDRVYCDSTMITDEQREPIYEACITIGKDLFTKHEMKLDYKTGLWTNYWPATVRYVWNQVVVRCCKEEDALKLVRESNEVYEKVFKPRRIIPPSQQGGPLKFTIGGAGGRVFIQNGPV